MYWAALNKSRFGAKQNCDLKYENLSGCSLYNPRAKSSRGRESRTLPVPLLSCSSSGCGNKEADPLPRGRLNAAGLRSQTAFPALTHLRTLQLSHTRHIAFPGNSITTCQFTKNVNYACLHYHQPRQLHKWTITQREKFQPRTIKKTCYEHNTERQTSSPRIKNYQ